MEGVGSMEIPTGPVYTGNTSVFVRDLESTWILISPWPSENVTTRRSSTDSDSCTGRP